MFTAQFLVDNCSLQWADVLWGYRHQFIGWRTPVDMASSKLSMGPPFDALEVELAIVGKDEVWKVGDFLEQLAIHTPVVEETSKAKWLFLKVLWTYENRDTLADPLGEIELIYADFDYPDEISPFVGFMPPDDGFDPSAHTVEKGRERMMEKWKGYIDQHRLSAET